MGENLRQDLPFSSPDRGGPAACSCESNLTFSDSSSVTVDGSDVFLHRNATAGEDSPAEWTDEKHNLFLKSLEMSFVKQLHHSMALRGWRLRRNGRGPYSSLNLSARTYSSSDQNGDRQKIYLKRKEVLSDSALNPHYIKESPWVCHFKSPNKCHATASSDLQEISLHFSEGTGIRGKLSDSERKDAVGSIAEFSDQNFVEEGQKNNSSHLFEAKRQKTINADISSNDQVVPFGKFKPTDVSTASQASSLREEKVHQESLPDFKHPQIFAHPKSNLHDFVRGS